MHSTYPQQPAYARGVELTIDGVISGFILQRFGLPACVASHYLFDAWCEVIVLQTAPPQIMWTAALPFLIPFGFLVACVYAVKKYGIIDWSQVQPKVEGAPAEKTNTNIQVQSEPSPQFRYVPLSSKAVLSKLVMVACVIAILPAIWKFEVIGERAKPLSVGRDQAIEIARKYFAESKISLDGYVPIAWLQTTSVPDMELVYVKEKLGFEKTREIANATWMNSPGRSNLRSQWNRINTRVLLTNQVM